MNINKTLLSGVFTAFIAIPVAFTIGVSSAHTQAQARRTSTPQEYSPLTACPSHYTGGGVDGAPSNGSHCLSQDTQWCQTDLHLKTNSPQNRFGCFIGPDAWAGNQHYPGLAICCVNVSNITPTPQPHMCTMSAKQTTCSGWGPWRKCHTTTYNKTVTCPPVRTGHLAPLAR